MAHVQPAAAPFGAIFENPTLRTLFVGLFGSAGVNLWIAANAPLPGYGNLLGGVPEATVAIPDEVPAHQPGPNVPITSIFGFPNTFSFSQAKFPKAIIAAPSPPLNTTVEGANVLGAFAPQIPILLALLLILLAAFVAISFGSFKKKLTATEMLLAWTQAKYDAAVQEKDEASERERKILDKLDKLDSHSTAVQAQLLKDLAEAKQKTSDSFAVEAELRQQLTDLEKKLRQELDAARKKADDIRKDLQDAIKRSAAGQAKSSSLTKANASLTAELATVNAIVESDGKKIGRMECRISDLESTIRGHERDKEAVSLAHARALQKKDAEFKKAKADLLAQLAAANFRPEVADASTQTNAVQNIVQMIDAITQTSSPTAIPTSYASTQTDGVQQKHKVEQKDNVQLKDHVEEKKDAPVEKIQISKARLRGWLPEEYLKRLALQPPRATNILLILPYPCFDPLLANMPIPQPVAPATEGAVTCVDCHLSYTQKDLHQHFGLCRAFFENGAVYCLTTQKCYVDNAAFREQHTTFCAIEGCAEKVVRPEKRLPGVPGAPTGPKGLMGSKFASPSQS